MSRQCSICEKEITRFSKSGLCHSCANIERFKNPLEKEKCIRRKLLVDKETLYNLYWNDNKTLLELSMIFNVSGTCIKQRMIKFNIPSRTISQAKTGRKPNRKPKEKIIFKCSQCDKEITNGSKSGLCKSHSLLKRFSNPLEIRKLSIAQRKRDKSTWVSVKGEKNPNYKNGITLVQHYCANLECKTKITCQAIYCPRCAQRGERSHLYTSGFTPLSNMIRNLSEYKQWRKQVFQRDNYKCQECNATKCYLEAHHKNRWMILVQEFLKHYSQFSPIEDKETLVRLAMTYEPFWDVNNGITLCEKCHKLKISSFLLIKNTKKTF